MSTKSPANGSVCILLKNQISSFKSVAFELKPGNLVVGLGMVVLFSGDLGFYLHVFLSSLSPPLLLLVVAGRENNPDLSVVEKWLSWLSGRGHASRLQRASQACDHRSHRAAISIAKLKVAFSVFIS